MNIKDIKKIDMHAHAKLHPELAPDRPGIEPCILSREQVLEVYDKINIETGVLLPCVDLVGTTTLLPCEDNKIMADRSNGRFKWFFNLSPKTYINSATADLSSFFEHYLKLGAKGVGEVTSNLYADDPKMDNLFRHCSDFKLPVIIHMHTEFDRSYGIVDDLHLPRLEKMLKKHKDMKILGHSVVFWSEISGDVTEATRENNNKGKVTDGGAIVNLMREYGNLCCDISAGSGWNAMTRDKEFTARFFEEFADRIYYGCDVCTLQNVFQYDFSDFLENMVKDGYLSIENYAKIVRNNAAEILDMPKYEF